MLQNRALSLLLAVLALGTIAVAASSLDDAVETDPDDVIDVDSRLLPLSQGDVSALGDAINDQGDGGGSSADGNGDGSSTDGNDDARSGGQASQQGDGSGESDTSQGGGQGDASDTDDSSGDGGAALPQNDPDADQESSSEERERNAQPDGPGSDDSRAGGEGDGSGDSNGGTNQDGEGSSSSGGGEGDVPGGASDQSGDRRGGGGNGGADQSGPGMTAPTSDGLLSLLASLLLIVLALVALYVGRRFYRRYREEILAVIDGLLPGDSPERATTPTGPGWPATADDDVAAAWLALCRRLDPHGGTPRTTAEWAAAAVEAGYDPEAVNELRRTYERVRYGGYPPTEDRRERARSVAERLGLHLTGGVVR